MTFSENQNRPLACLDEEALKDITAPANLNSGELQDVYRLQTSDFDEPETLEVFYNDGKGGTLREIVFVDPIYADRRPRICVSIDGIQAMHKTISTLTRKVDNLVETLQRCRGAYYKELSMLREQLYQQALVLRDGGPAQTGVAATLYDPSAFISQTESEVDLEVKKKTETLSAKLRGLETENLRLKKRVAILSIEVTHIENQLATRGQKMDIRDMCFEILDRVKIDTLIRTLRGLMEEHQQELFYNTLEEVLSDFRGLKISDLLKQNQEDAEKISKLGLELLKAKQDLATAIREEKQASEALSQTTKMWQNAESFCKDLEQSLEDAQSELADAKEQVDALKKEPGFLREKIAQLKEEQQKEIETLQNALEGVRKELAEEKSKEPPSTLGLGAMGRKGTQQFEGMADVIASTQQSFGTQEQFAISLNILKGTPNAQITKTAEMLKAIVEEARPNLLKELLNVDHATLGTSKQRLAMAQKIMNNVPQEDSALVADIIPPGTGKEMAVKVLEASASEEASGENNANACGFDPNIDISKKCKWSLMRRFIKKLNSTEIKNLFDELGQRARKAILLDMFDLADPNDLEACAEMIVVEPSIKAFVKGLSDEACDFFLQHTAQRLGEDKAVAVVAPQLAKIKESRHSIVRHHETVQTEFSCVSDELVLSKGAKEQSIFTMDFMLTELPHRPQSAMSQISHRSQDGWHENGIHSESVGLPRRHSQAFGYRGARTEDTLTVVEEAVQQATAEAEAEVAVADKEKALAEAAKEAALAKEKELEAELEALKANMEREIQERSAKIQEVREAAEGDDGTAMAALLAHAKEEAKRAADEKIKEKERALKAAQEAAESQAAAFLERQEAALKAAELLAQREAESREAKRKAEEEAAAMRAQRRASDVKIEEAARSMAAAEAAKMAALREREEALEMKALLERRHQEEEEARHAFEARQAQLEAQRLAAEAAERALEESHHEGLSAEERETLQTKAAEEKAAKEAAEQAAQEAQALAAFAQQRAVEAEKQMNEATVTAHFQVLAKLSRVQAAYASLEDRLRLQEEVTASAEKRAKEAEEREEQLCLLVSAKALARQVRQRDRMAQTLLVCEQNDEEQWRFAVDGQPAHLQWMDGEPAHLQSSVHGDMVTLAAQYLADSRDDEDPQVGLVNLRTLTEVQEFVNATAEAQGHSLRNSPPRTPGTDVRARASPLEVQNVAPRARPKTFSIAIQTDLARPEDRILPERGEQRAPVAAVAAVAPGSAGKTKTESPRDAGLDIEHVRDSMQVLLHNGARSPSATAQRRPSLERQGSDVDEVIPHAESTAPSVPAAVAKTGDGSQESPQALQLAPRHSSEIRTGDGSQESPQALQLAPRHSSEIRLPPGAVTSRTEAQHAKPAKPLEVGMTPSTSSASLAQTALPSQQLFEVFKIYPQSYSSSSVQASQLSTELTAEPAIFELPADPAIFATRPSSKGQKNSKVAVERRSATDQTDMSVRRRTPLDDMDLSPRENRLGDENRPQTGETLTSKSPTSKRLLHLSRGDGDFELSNQAVQAELQEVRADPELETKMSGKQLASSLGRKDAGAPQKAAQEAAEAVKAAMKSKGLEENEAHELAALCAGVAASEAAAQSGYSPQDATNFAGTEALAAAKASGFPDDLSLQCTSQALGAVIGRAAAESKWTPSRAASCAADVVRRFVDVNDISYDNLVSMTAMSAHEAAETVALVQKLRPEEAAMVGAEAASRITTEVVTKILRQHADYAVQQAGAKQTVQHTLAVHEPSTPSGRPEVSASSSRHSSRGPNSHERAPLPRLPPALPGQAPETAPVPAGPEVAPSRSFVRPQVTRRLSISELTLPAMAPSTSRRPSQMQPLLGDGTVGPPSPSSPQPNEQYPDASRIMSYGSGRTTEVDRRASTYLQQMQERRASLSLRRMEPPEPPAQSRSNAPAGAKPKLQGWQRVREVNDRGRAEKRVRTPSRLTPRNAQIDIGEISSPEAPTERRRSFVEHMQAQAQQKVQRPAPVAPVAPAQPPSLSQAAGRVMRLGMAVGNKVKRDGPELALDAAFVLQEAVKQRQGKLRKPERARAPDLRIDAARPEEVLLNSQRRSSQRYQPEARQPTEPFAPDVDGLFVAAGTRSEALAAGDATPSVRDARPVSKTASTSFQRQAPGLEGKTFNGLASPGSTARSMEPDPGNVADVLSVSQLSSSKSFYKSQSREIFRPNEQDALSRAPDAEDPDTDQLEDLEMVHRTSSRVLPQLSSLAPSVVPVGPRKSECEADLLVQRICSSLDGKFGSVDAAFLSMSAKLQRVEAPTAEGAESTEDKEDRKLVQLRSCLVESGVGFKDATVLLQAMRSGLAGAMPTLQHVANSLRPGQLPQEAIELAKKKGAFSLSGSDDPNINLESIRGFSNLDARSILQRPGREGREGLEGRDGRAPPSAAGTRSGSPNRTRSHSNSPSRSKSKGASVAGHE